MKNQQRRRVVDASWALRLALIAGTVAGSGSASAQTVSQWLSATSGNWTDASRWSTDPFFPNNGNGNPLYRAEILATGSNYTITLNSSIALDSLLLNSANATISHTSGTLTLGGTATLTAGSYTLNGGTILGGTIDNTANRLSFSSSAGNTLNGVSFLGGFGLTGLSWRTNILNGLSATGTVNVSGTGSSIRFLNSGTFSGGGTLNIQGGSAASLCSLSVEGTSAFTLAAGSSITGRHARIGNQLMTAGANSFINNGTVTAGVTGVMEIMSSSFTNSGTAQASSGGTLTVSSANWSNSGTLAANSGSTLNLNGNWSNTGSILASSGTVNLGGTFSGTGLSVTNTGGTVNLAGVMNNTGNTLAFSAGTGSWNAVGGTVNGGTLSFSGGGQLNLTSTQSTFNNVTINGDWNHSAGFGSARIQNNFTSSGTVRTSGASGLAVDFSSAVIDADFELGGGGSALTFLNAGSTTAASSITATAGTQGLVGAATFTSNGLVRATGAGTRFDVRPDTIINNGTVRVDTGATLALGFKTAGFSTNLTNNGTIEVDNGILELSGNLNTSTLGTINRTGGSIQVYADLENTGQTLNLASRGGSWQVNALSINGGTLATSAGNTLLFTNTNQLTLTNVAINGNLSITGGTGSGHENYCNISGNISTTGTFSFDGAYAGGSIFGNTTLTGTYAFNTASGPSNIWAQQDSGILTISSGTLVRGGNGGFGGVTGTSINNGTIRADVAGAFIGFGSGTTINNGVLQLAGGNLGIGGANSLDLGGTVNMSGGTLTLGSGTNGTISLRSGLVFSRTGGTVVIAGNLDNTGKTLTLDSSTGSWNLFGSNGQSRLIGGTLVLHDGEQFRRGIYDNVTVNGSFSVGSGETVAIRNHMSLNGTITIGAGGSLGIDTGLSATPVALAGGTVSMYVSGSDTARINWTSSTAAIFDTGTLVTGGGQLAGNFNATIGLFGAAGAETTLINRGIIECSGADKELFLRPNHVVNEGIMRAVNGGLLRVANELGCTWDNIDGEIIADGADVRFYGRGATSTMGTVRAINGGRVLLNGALDNSGSTLTLSNTTGSFIMSGGIIKGGHISRSGSAGLLFDATGSGSNVLDGVTFDQDFEIQNYAPGVAIRNSLDVNGVFKLTGVTSASFEGDQTFNGTILLNGSGVASAAIRGGATNRPATFTLGSAALVHGGNGVINTHSESTVINQGTISADVNGQSIRIYLQRFLNEGTLQEVNGGVLEFIPPGGLDGRQGTLINSGNMIFTHATTINADVVQTDLGATWLTLSSGELSGEETVLAIRGSAVLEGSVVVSLGEGVQVAQGDVIRLVSAWGLEWGDTAQLVLPELRGELSWDRQHIAGGVLKVVPAPSTLGLLLAGATAASRRRRR